MRVGVCVCECVCVESCSGSVCAVSYCVFVREGVSCYVQYFGVLCGLLCAVCSVVYRRAESRHEPGGQRTSGVTC